MKPESISPSGVKPLPNYSSNTRKRPAVCASPLPCQRRRTVDEHPIRRALRSSWVLLYRMAASRRRLRCTSCASLRSRRSDARAYGRLPAEKVVTILATICDSTLRTRLDTDEVTPGASIGFLPILTFRYPTPFRLPFSYQRPLIRLIIVSCWLTLLGAFPLAAISCAFR